MDQDLTRGVLVLVRQCLNAGRRPLATTLGRPVVGDASSVARASYDLALCPDTMPCLPVIGAGRGAAGRVGRTGRAWRCRSGRRVAGRWRSCSHPCCLEYRSGTGSTAAMLLIGVFSTSLGW